jgi:hypothetical protein
MDFHVLNLGKNLNCSKLRKKVSGAFMTDTQLAALTRECGGVLHTTDRDFARFPGLRWKNPLTWSEGYLQRPASPECATSMRRHS